MLTQYPTYGTSKFSKLKSRTRKGIPDSLRGYVWQKFANVSTLTKPNIYNTLVESKDCDPLAEAVILKALDRTFPHNFIFQDKYGSGQRQLYRVRTQSILGMSRAWGSSLRCYLHIWTKKVLFSSLTV